MNIGGKIELSAKNTFIILGALMAIVLVATYFFVFSPLMKELRKYYLKCKSIESEVSEYRSIISLAGQAYDERGLVTSDEVTQAIDELTKHGTKLGIDFITISPKEVKESEDPRFKILPVEMRVRSSYKQLGSFLGSLDELKKGLIKVDSFDIDPHEIEKSIVATDLTVDIYFSSVEEEG